jgi:uncharacterized membrane protein YphA (DoxX/SURF4 family)
VKPIAALISRLALAAIFIYAAWVKLAAPWYTFASNIDSYRLLPPDAVVFLAHTLPWFELALGLMLLTPFRVRWVTAVCGLLLTGFWGSMLRAYLLGMNIDCGCFGPGEPISPLTLSRDALMLVLAAFVWWAAGARPVPPSVAAQTGPSEH